MTAVVVLFHTIMDGPVLRWYHTEFGFEAGNEYMSVSRNGVYISEFLDRIPSEEIAKAKQAAKELTKWRPDVSQYPTHETSFVGSRKLKPIQRGEAVAP